MSGAPPAAAHTGGGVREAEAVNIEWASLGRGDPAVLRRIGEAFGPDGLGLLTVSGVPGYAEARGALLPLASRLAALDEGELARMEDPEGNWNFGWSHGRETLEGGAPDRRKGSFYANPSIDVPTSDAGLVAAFPSYCRPNVWPAAGVLDDLEPAFKALGRLSVRVGSLLAAECDRYVLNALPDEASRARYTRLQDVVDTSPACKARLLHYYPPSPDDGGDGDSSSDVDGQDGPSGTWCGWHTDHGSLTGLAGGMYVDAEGREVGNPDPGHAGLHVRNRRGETVRVAIPAGCMAFQVGETTQVLSGGLLRATPHAVVAARPGAPSTRGVSRASFAVFMQPRWDTPMASPLEGADVGVGAWRPGLDFGAFTNATLEQYY